MSSEQNAPEVYEYQGQQAPSAPQENDAQFTATGVPHGMGQSKSSRRRRRKRKNKGGDSHDAPQHSAQPGDQPSPQSVPSIQAASPQSQTQPQRQNQSHQGGQQHSGAGKRWKKKFRDRDRQRAPENPGNIASGSNGGGYSNNGGGFRDRDTHQPGNSA